MSGKVIATLVKSLQVIKQEITRLETSLIRKMTPTDAPSPRRTGWGHLSPAERSAIGQKAAKTRRQRRDAQMRRVRALLKTGKKE